jgi:hypothetical protein
MQLARYIIASVTIIYCFSAAAAGYGGYSGKGGMSAYAIKPNVYEYHYDHGFTGPDAMGWNPNLHLPGRELLPLPSVAFQYLLKRSFLNSSRSLSKIN